MSEQKLVSPLLDGFLIGEPMSDHDGIVCCPAIRENTEEKYIVKIISVPASQKQLDALLLTGAYPDAAAATDYFKEMAEGVVKEAELLKQLSKLEGFLPYEDWQVVPMEGSKLGYQIYLLSPYKRSLDKHLRRNTMTHLGAVRMALDLCAALSICRRAGFMHIDLKPGNIFITSKQEYRIGDLGFAKLNSLKYTSLPAKYCSGYTAPELRDPMNTLNPTADIYAVGMILYQIYNGGILPVEEQTNAEPLPAPQYADYELAEIIQKACDPNPRKRYQTPIEMGQALVAYMQRNAIVDDPIIPPAAEPLTEEPLVPAENPETEAPAQELEFTEESVPDETVPDEQDAELSDELISEETSAILAQAEELMEESVCEEPESSVEPAIPEEPTFEEESDFQFSLPAEPVPEVTPTPKVEDPFVPYEEPKKKGKFGKFLITMLLLGALAAGGFYFYQNYYLVHIDTLVIQPVEDTLEVSVITNTDAELTVSCTDAYGTSYTAAVDHGFAVFSQLNPGTVYKIEVTAEGFHGMTGSTVGTATTVSQTVISDLAVVTGTENGSAILSFQVEGPEEDWILQYKAEGEEMGTISFTGHSVTVSNLTVGRDYTFSLITAPGSQLYVVGDRQIKFTASNLVLAQNLTILSCNDGVLTAQWNAPEDAIVDRWIVRCYNEGGYDETITVMEPAVQFSGIQADTAYTLEVTAENMTQSIYTKVSANPTTITDISVNDSDPSKLVLTWNSNQMIPEGGWLVTYTLNSGAADQVITCAENTATILQIIPGTQYRFNIQAADGSTVFGGSYAFATAQTSSYKGNGINAADVTGSFCPTPDKSDWTYKNIPNSAYTATYTPGAKVSLLLYSPDKAGSSNETISVMFVFRDVEGNILPDLTSVVSDSWNDLWGNRTRYCGLNLPKIPAAVGQYTVDIYFNQQLMISKTLTITE